MLRVTWHGAGRAVKLTIGAATLLELTLLTSTMFGVTFGILVELEATMFSVTQDAVRFVFAADALGATGEVAFVEGEGEFKSIPARSDLPCWIAM